MSNLEYIFMSMDFKLAVETKSLDSLSKIFSI